MCYCCAGVKTQNGRETGVMLLLFLNWNYSTVSFINYTVSQKSLNLLIFVITRSEIA